MPSASMFTFAFVHVVLSLLLPPFAHTTATCPEYGVLVSQLGRRLSPGSSVSSTTINAPRWSLYGAPDPAFVVNVASESDVATTVRSGPKEVGRLILTLSE